MKAFANVGIVTAEVVSVVLVQIKQIADQCVAAICVLHEDRPWVSKHLSWMHLQLAEVSSAFDSVFPL